MAIITTAHHFRTGTTSGWNDKKNLLVLVLKLCCVKPIKYTFRLKGYLQSVG
jgi:hypothetical protein